MLSRRTALAGLATTTALLPTKPSQAEGANFADLLSIALSHPNIMTSSLAGREGPAVEFDVFAVRVVAPRYKPSSVKVSNDTLRMIIASEVSSQVRYEARYQQPLWPGGQSGVTVGVGYDVGYSTPDWLQEDWGGILPATDLALLKTACKITGTSANAMLKSVAALRIGWADAYKQFITTALPRWTAETVGNLPNAEKLPPDCLGALVSLDYNRGPAWKLTDDRHREMRAIRLHMVNEEYTLIPAEIRSMTRLWIGEPALQGLVIRRNLEAALFEKGLKAA
jgi:hypothetical protein